MSMRHIRDPIQYDRPLFCKVPLQVGKTTLQAGKPFNWKERAIDRNRVRSMYQQGLLYHDDDLAEAFNEKRVGDGLDELDITALHELVDKINEKVKAQVKNEKEWDRKKCPTSKILDKQRGLIRRWRLSYGKMEV